MRNIQKRLGFFFQNFVVQSKGNVLRECVLYTNNYDVRDIPY